MDFPPDGLYFITVHGWSVPAGTTTFTNKYSITQTGGTSNFRGVCPTTTIPPNTPSGCQVEWRFPGDQAPGPQSGFLFVSPGYAPYALVQLLNIAFVLDYTPPSVDPTRDLSPVPTSLINDAAASVVANIGDPAGQIDRFSVQLLVDGMDVTSASKVLVPYSSTAPVGYSLLTIAWEHPTMRFSDGTHSAVVNCKDMAGNLLTYVWGWTVDTMAPNLAITSPSSDGFTNQVSWAFTARTDPGSTVTVTSNGVAQIASVSPEGVVTATIAFATDGVYTIVVTSADALGNTATASRTVTRDTAAPVLFATADLYGPTNRDSTVVTGNVNEHVVEVLVNGQPVTIAADGSFTAVVALVEGTNRIVVSTQDDAGNTASVTLATITRDTVSPTIRVQLLDVNGDPVLPVITSIDTQNVTVSVTIPDTDVFFVTINGQSVVRNAQGKFVLSQVPLAVGDNTFVIRAQDEAGNGAESVASVSYAPVVVHETANYNSVIASGVAVVLLIVGFVVGYLLSGRGGGARPTEAKGESPTRAEEELPREEERAPEEEEL